VLGPLPPLHRVVVCVLALLAPVGVGAWLAWSTPGPLLPTVGAVIGASLGVALVFLLLRQTPPGPRIRRPR
jgi:hypothetical protein